MPRGPTCCGGSGGVTRRLRPTEGAPVRVQPCGAALPAERLVREISVTTARSQRVFGATLSGVMGDRSPYRRRNRDADTLELGLATGASRRADEGDGAARGRPTASHPRASTRRGHTTKRPIGRLNRIARRALPRRPDHRRRPGRPAGCPRGRQAGRRSGSSPRSTRSARTRSRPRAGINAALNPEDTWESHAFDTVKGSDYLGDQDAIEIMCREAPDEILWLEHAGVTFHRNEDRAPRHARVRRRLRRPHLLRRRHHRPGDPARALRAADEAPRAGRPLRGVVHDRPAPGRRGPLRRRDLPQPARRPAGGVQRQGDDPRLRRRRPGLQADHQRADRDRRRDRPGLPDRREADGHGDDPVPPDDARRATGS